MSNIYYNIGTNLPRAFHVFQLLGLLLFLLNFLFEYFFFLFKSTHPQVFDILVSTRYEPGPYGFTLF